MTTRSGSAPPRPSHTFVFLILTVVASAIAAAVAFVVVAFVGFAFEWSDAAVGGVPLSSSLAALLATIIKLRRLRKGAWAAYEAGASPFRYDRDPQYQPSSPSNSEALAQDPTDRPPPSPLDQDPPPPPAPSHPKSRLDALGIDDGQAQLSAADLEQDYFYLDDGKQYGPLPAHKLLALIQSNRLSQTVSVWRRGWPQWKKASEIDLSRQFVGPPPVPMEEVGNGWVWAAALMPLVMFSFFDTILYFYLNDQQAAAILPDNKVIHILDRFQATTMWGFSLICCGIDFNQLRKFKLVGRFFGITAFVMVPLYLFLRASKLKQFPGYGIAWIVSILIVAFLYSLREG